MLQIEYCKEGKAFSDFNLLEEAQKLIDEYLLKKDIFYIKVSTSNIIQALRVLVSRNALSIVDITFKFENNIINLNGKFELTEYPIGFMDWQQKLLRELLEKKIGIKF